MSENLILGGPASGYKYEFRPDGVYFTVYPNVDGERLFELSDMRNSFKDNARGERSSAKNLRACANYC